MPYISVECGALSGSQKEDLIARLTQTASETLCIPPEFFTVTIKELPDKCYGIGGRTIDRIKQEWAAGSSGQER